MSTTQNRPRRTGIRCSGIPTWCSPRTSWGSRRGAGAKPASSSPRAWPRSSRAGTPSMWPIPMCTRRYRGDDQTTQPSRSAHRRREPRPSRAKELLMRIALFGCGRIGRVHADAIASHPRAELAWVCDPMQDIARELAAQHATSATADTAAVLADPTIDAVVIASSTPTHVDLLARAVRSGKAVLCEKPIDLDIARVDACWAEIGAAEPLVMVGFNRRFDSSIREVRDRIRAGEIGRLEQLAITSRDPAPPPAEYIAKSGGLFRDMTIHDLDLARFMLGEVVEVQAMGANLVEDYVEKCGDIDTAVVIMRSA